MSNYRFLPFLAFMFFGVAWCGAESESAIDEETTRTQIRRVLEGGDEISASGSIGECGYGCYSNDDASGILERGNLACWLFAFSHSSYCHFPPSLVGHMSTCCLKTHLDM